MLVVAVPVAPPDDELALRSAASTLARACGGVLRPLTVVRHDEIVIVRGLERHDPRELTDPVARAQRGLAAGGVRLAIGLSTAFETTAGIPAAYAEACTALESLGPDGGVLSLADLSAFDYLTLRADATARRLVSDRVRRFVEDDTATGSTLTDTLLVYAQANLNAKVAAERLYIHVNTAHHRLARIEEKTGCDLRDLTDVQELLIATKLTRGQAGPGRTDGRV